MPDFRFRVAGPGDVDAIVALHLGVWRRSMRELAPPAAYAALDEAYRTAQWTGMLGSPGPDDLWLLCERDGIAVGIGGACAPSIEDFGGRGEIRFLYIDDTAQRCGLGRQFLARLSRHLAERGYDGVALSVVEGNHPARAFYARLGGREIGRHRFPSEIWPSIDVIVAWDDLRVLAAPPLLTPSSARPAGRAAGG
jgi:ribosomal protein S18 acetylase RimI-like enzyme